MAVDQQLIDIYLEKHSSPESELLHQLTRETNLKVVYAQMISGHLQGRLLALISKMICPKLILEIGTFTGYSAICLAEGLVPGGQLITIDSNEEIDALARKYFALAGLEEQITKLTGKAVDILPTLEGDVDLVFLDADKINYALYYDIIIDKVRPGGFILADNVLWYGKVVESVLPSSDKDTPAIKAFNEKIQQDSRVENVMLPIRDGLTIIRKK